MSYLLQFLRLSRIVKYSMSIYPCFFLTLRAVTHYMMATEPFSLTAKAAAAWISETSKSVNGFTLARLKVPKEPCVFLELWIKNRTVKINQLV